LNGDAVQDQVHLPDELRNDSRVRIATDKSGNTNVGYLKNKAFRLGKGDILIEMVHDDLLTPNCLEKLHEAYQDEEIGFVYSDNAKLPMNGQFTPYNAACGWTYEMFNWKNNRPLYHMHSFEPSAAAMAFIWYMPDHVRSWRKKVYHNVGGHDPLLSVLDDQDLIVRTYLKTKFKFINEVLYIYRITGENTWLERNQIIQTETVNMFHRYGQKLAERDAELNGLRLLDIGGGIDGRKGYETVDMEGADIICDLNDGIPVPDNSVGVINASHVLEHLKDPLKSMTEIYRVLADGGWAFIDVPSTDGRGAWMDPTHVSFWNQNSFLYYTRQSQARYIRNNTVRFQDFRCQTYFPGKWWQDNNIPVVTAWLRAIKSDKRRPHLIHI
jgi:SAM-dependent methyltransferase